MQQINLYLPEFQPNHEPLRSIQMFWGLVAFIILLLLWGFYSANANKKLQQEVVQGRTQLAQLGQQLTQLTQQQPHNNLQALDEHIVRLGNDLERRQQVLAVIANKNLGNNSGFSAHLQALGRQSLDTVTLDIFSLQNGGHYVELAGKTVAADQLPLYLQRLRSEPVFAQTGFGVLHLSPAKNANGVFEFTLAKMLEEPQKNERPKTAVQMLMELNRDAEENP